MKTSVERPLETMSFKTLIECGTQELRKYSRRESSNEGYCLELFRRAIVLHDQEAWAALQTLLREQVRMCFARHPYRDMALRYEPSVQTYIDDTFRRLWLATNHHGSMFPSLASALKYLRLCMNATIMDVLRASARPCEECIPEGGFPGEPAVEDTYHEGELWEVLNSLFPGERERCLIFLFFHCNLKPRDIMRYAPGVFRGEAEIYSMKRNILERILRHREQIRRNLDDGACKEH
jgi:hypothetical protein